MLLRLQESARPAPIGCHAVWRAKNCRNGSTAPNDTNRLRACTAVPLRHAGIKHCRAHSYLWCDVIWRPYGREGQLPAVALPVLQLLGLRPR
jgi:hypothetical protein